MQHGNTLRWDDMQLVLTLCRRGSLKGAATDLGVNVSTVGRRLDALEAALSQHLFDRTPEGTRPTAVAAQLLPFAERMERAAMEAAHALDSLEAEPEGVVRLAAPPGFAEQFLAPALVDLMARYPRLRVEVLASIGYADLTRREADIAIRIMRPTAGDLVATRLGTSDYVVLGSATVAQRLGPLRRLDDTPWITYGEDLAHLPEVAWVTEHVAPHRIALRTNSLTTQLEAVRAGLGVKIEARPFLTRPGLTEVELAPALAHRLRSLPEASLWLVGHRALRDVPRIAAVWTRLLDHYRVP